MTVCFLALGLVFSLASCELLGNDNSSNTKSGGGSGSGNQYGTVRVYNNSQYPTLDARVFVGILDNNNNVVSSAYVDLNSYFSYSSLTPGALYSVGVLDGLDEFYYTNSFTVSAGQTRTFSFNGDSIINR